VNITYRTITLEFAKKTCNCVLLLLFGWQSTGLVQNRQRQAKKKYFPHSML